MQASTGPQANRTTNFLWDVNHDLPQLALERDGGGSLQRQYIYGLARIRQSAGTASYYHYDGLGSVVNLTSASGTTTQWTWSYEPYGSIRTEQKASGNQPDNFLNFTGEYLDPTGLYHLRARQYDRVSGRFLSVDPLEPLPGAPSISPYAYSDDRPTILADPSGEGALEPTVSGTDAARAATSSPQTNLDPMSLTSGANNCTVVPDAIGVSVLRLIDFSPSCAAHDTCYGTWLSFRKDCDDDFHEDMRAQCSSEFQHTILLRPIDAPRRKACNKIAGIYHYGVQQLGGTSWDDKAHRFDFNGPGIPPDTACPYAQTVAGTGWASTRRANVERCVSEVLLRSYKPLYPTRPGIAAEIAKQIAKALVEVILPIPVP